MSYRSGSAKCTINPDTSIFSLALAGYGAPDEGRFSLVWQETDQPVKFSGVPTGALIEKKLKSIHGYTAIAVVGSAVYAADQSGDIYVNRSIENNDQWNVCGKLNKVMSMTSDGQQLFALDESQSIWRGEIGTSVKWIKIARKNGYSINTDLRQIFHHAGEFYGLDVDGKLLRAAHGQKYDLYATAVALDDGNNKVVLIGLDCTGFNHSFTTRLKDAVEKYTGMPPEAILINASHTHFSPVTQKWSTWQEFYQEPDADYLNRVVMEGAIKAVISALSEMEPVEIRFIRGSTDIGYNRRNDVQPGAGYDNTLDLIQIINSEGQLKQLIYLAACHPVFKNQDSGSPFTISPNFPGVCRELLQHDHKADVLFLQGFAGDINPVHPDYEQTGYHLYKDIKNLMTEPGEVISGQISYSLNEIETELQCLSSEEFDEFYESNYAAVAELSLAVQPDNPVGQFVLTPLMEKKKNLRWVSLMRDRGMTGLPVRIMPVYIQIINIGQWKLVGLSREVVSDYAEPIRKLWPGQAVSLAAYCNDVSSYLPCDWHIDKQTYEGYDSFYWYGEPGIPARNVKDQVLKQIENLKL